MTIKDCFSVILHIVNSVISNCYSHIWFVFVLLGVFALIQARRDPETEMWGKSDFKLTDGLLCGWMQKVQQANFLSEQRLVGLKSRASANLFCILFSPLRTPWQALLCDIPRPIAGYVASPPQARTDAWIAEQPRSSLDEKSLCPPG